MAFEAGAAAPVVATQQSATPLARTDASAPVEPPFRKTAEAWAQTLACPGRPPTEVAAGLQAYRSRCPRGSGAQRLAGATWSRLCSS